MEHIIFSRIRADLKSWQTRWAFLTACWSQGMYGWISYSLHSCNILSHILAGLSHMLPQNVKISRLKCSFVPFSSLCMFYSVALFIFLKYFLFICVSWQRPPCVFITVFFFWSLCQLYCPRLATSVLQGLQFLRSTHGVNRKPKITFHLPIHSVQV